MIVSVHISCGPVFRGFHAIEPAVGHPLKFAGGNVSQCDFNLQCALMSR